MVAVNLSVGMVFTLICMVIVFLSAFIFDRHKFKHKYDYMRNHYISIIMALAAAIDSRDPSTLGHTERVTRLAKKMADELQRRGYKIDVNFRESLQLAALLHDIGKIGVPDSILRKPGPPTDEEWKQLKKHPDIGANILEPLDNMAELKKAVRFHQEHYDGLGYPRGLKAKEIPMISRIIMIIDAYDAIISDRTYRKSRPKKDALEEIKANAGTQFDPKLVEAFIHVMSKEP